MRLFVVTVDLGNLKSSTMKRLSALFLPFLIFCSPLSSQDFLSIHISDVATNTKGVRTNIYLSHQDVDSVQSELKIATILMAADLDYFLTIDKSTPYHYSNNVNLKQFNVSTNEAFVVISGTGVIDGKYIIDEYWGELDLLSQSNWGRISISGSINVPFQGLDHQLRLSSPHLETSSNIFNTPLQSIDFSGFTPFTSYDVSYIETQNNIATVERDFYSDSYFQIGSFASAQAAINSYNIDSDLLDSDGDGYAVWRDDDDNNPSITQANGIYTLSSALTEIASLESQKSSLIAERDAKLSLEEIVDLRAGSSMVAISNGQATLSMEVEESSDLGIWTTGGTASVQMNVQPGEDKKFFRFKMNDSDSSNKDINLSIEGSEYDEAAIIQALADQYGVPASSISLSVNGG